MSLTSEAWCRHQHPLSERDARELVRIMCIEGDLGAAFALSDQIRGWLLTRNSWGVTSNYEEMLPLFEFWDGVWIVLLNITVTDPKTLRYQRLKRIRARTS